MMRAPRRSCRSELGFVGVILCRRVVLTGTHILPPAKTIAIKSANLFAYLETGARLVSMQSADEPQAEDESETETKI